MKGCDYMPVHHGGKVGNAAAVLARRKSPKKKKQEASKILNEHKKNFRIFGPDEALSNRLNFVFEETNRKWNAIKKDNIPIV